MTYDNARIPHAIFLAFESTKDKRFLDAAERSFQFLVGKTIDNGVFVPIGQDGWFPKGGAKALFDQQPVEAGGITEAAIAGFNATGKDSYRQSAIVAFEWFLGRNIGSAPLYDETNGACFDGLTKEGPNKNQGAESAISYLMARLAVEELKTAAINGK